MTTEFFHRHRSGFLLFLYLSFSTFCLTIDVDRIVTGLKTVVWFLVSPEVVYTGKFFNKLDALGGRLFELVRVEGENHILKQQNAQLAKREVEKDALEKENNRLRALLDLTQKSFPHGVTAEVIGHDPREWFHALILNKGKAQHISLSAAVVVINSGRPTLVGRVLELGQNTSRVLLLTDVVSAISVQIAGKGDLGLLEGRNSPWAAINYLTQQSQIAVGDEVLTAGLGGVFPADILVGHITGVKMSDNGFFKQAEMLPFADFGSVREVLVLDRQDNSPGENSL